MQEEWRDILGFPGYKISNLGRVQGIRVPILKRLYSIRGGEYPFVDLRGRDAEGNLKRKISLIHILVAEAFLGPRPKGTLVHHKDHKRENACVSNLEYVTHVENSRL
ncbi:hypothetical protein A2886_02865 [candidate division WWE3 bacterium RIFCSPHIGHO2_01_FULL_42_13]|uniref:HNH nuclease domain-containing protein n=1 Tax=candidate division WWE3 bacterium RIFCSPHIGHO2_01_FULL_42_13 TaxID=1802617 RepID=A0A1F4UU20_UNCKA|nr:MAG: hypothetical protein A2886_02865 [candidate division WWE3 bacterium RIFCSPHIGHO2_01_FULL_42_13]